MEEGFGRDMRWLIMKVYQSANKPSKKMRGMRGGYNERYERGVWK